MCCFIFSLSLFATEKKLANRNFSPKVKAYLENYCLDCHGEKKQKADRRFDQIILESKGHHFYDPSDHHSVELLMEVLDLINLGEMPPDKRNVPQPSAKNTKEVVSWLTQEQDYINKMGKAPETVLRKLNGNEYRRTIRDLLRLGDVNYFNVAKYFDDDEREHGFANIGETLNLSEDSLSNYIEAADDYLNGALVWESTKPKPTILNMDFSQNPSSRRLKQYNESHVSYSVYQQKVGALDIAQGGKTTVYHHLFKAQTKEPIRKGKYSPIDDRYGMVKVPADGYYTIRIKADAVNRITHPYKGLYPAMAKQKMKLGLYVTSDSNDGFNNTHEKKRSKLAVFELEDNQVKVYTTRTWLYKGAMLCIRWDNFLIDEGTGSINGTFNKLYRGVHKQAIDNIDKFRASKGLKPYRHSVVHIKDKTHQRELLDLELFSDVFAGPRMRIYNLELSGPENPVWPPASHRALIGEETDPNKVQVKKMLENFLPRAFRRPVTQSEVTLYENWIANRMKSGVSKKEAIRDGIIFILSSPAFLYIQEPKGQLDTYALASRLSYFLWSSMPDDELFELAKNKTILKPEVIKFQVQRMLADPKAKGHVENFTDAWLHLYKLGGMPPDSIDHRDYYIWNVEYNMKRESRAFYEHILKTKAPLTDFLDSDYLVINEVMAQYYGIEGVYGDQFRKVFIDRHKIKRGGVLNQASILTASANGVETSPVLRGIWVLENILGTPPAPPPPDVESPEPDTRGATTIRDQLRKHRSNESCANCHAKIDPLGFPLESYGPTGKFRPHYYKVVDRVNSNGIKYGVSRKKRADIDSSGELVSGEKFKDASGFKSVLVKKSDQFYKALTEKLMVFATGRHMSYKDQSEIESIAKPLHASPATAHLEQLITEVALSDIFRTK